MMEINLKIGTLNLCLGLKGKKDLVKKILNENDIDILCMQELEITRDYDCNLLSIPGYILEIEENLNNRRVGYYIRDNVKYNRRKDLESLNCHIVILDLFDADNNLKRLIGIYRSFNPIGNTARNLFIEQLRIVKKCFNDESILMGDLNLDFNRKFDIDYCRADLFNDFDLHLDTLNLVQLIFHMY